MMRRTVILAVLGFWVVMLALLVNRNWPGPVSVPESELSAAAMETADWMGVYQEGEKIGYVQQSLHRGNETYEISQRSLLRLNILDTPQSVRTQLRGTAAADLSLRQFSFELESGLGSLRATGHVQGRKLRLEVQTGEERTEQTIALASPIYLPILLRASLGGGGLQPGKRVGALVFDPTSLRGDRIQIEVEGRGPVPGTERSAWLVREEFRGLESRAWLDDAGTVLREEGPMGLVLVREPREVALRDGWAAESALDLVAKAAVPVDRPIPSPREARLLRLRVRGIDVTGIPTDDEQVREGDVLTVHRREVAAAASYRLPYTGQAQARHLEPTMFLQSEHPRLRSLARRIVGDESDPGRAASKLSAWVYENLRKVPTVSLPNALQVLEMGAGDCNEHAVLFAALARAAGLPTRVVAGAVYLDGAFLYHAWCEVWLDRWVSVDPVLNQFPADATHIKFVVGGPQEHIAMMGIIGRLQVEVLDAGAQDPGAASLRR
jgi:hypothetical protein